MHGPWHRTQRAPPCRLHLLRPCAQLTVLLGGPGALAHAGRCPAYCPPQAAMQQTPRTCSLPRSPRRRSPRRSSQCRRLAAAGRVGQRVVGEEAAPGAKRAARLPRPPAAARPAARPARTRSRRPSPPSSARPPWTSSSQRAARPSGRPTRRWAMPTGLALRLCVVQPAACAPCGVGTTGRARPHPPAPRPAPCLAGGEHAGARDLHGAHRPEDKRVPPQLERRAQVSVCGRVAWRDVGGLLHARWGMAPLCAGWRGARSAGVCCWPCVCRALLEWYRLDAREAAIEQELAGLGHTVAVA